MYLGNRTAKCPVYFLSQGLALASPQNNQVCRRCSCLGATWDMSSPILAGAKALPYTATCLVCPPFAEVQAPQVKPISSIHMEVTAKNAGPQEARQGAQGPPLYRLAVTKQNLLSDATAVRLASDNALNKCNS